jgi:hypothetical protein
MVVLAKWVSILVDGILVAIKITVLEDMRIYCTRCAHSITM